MAVRTATRIVNPDDVEVTIEVTMTLREWEKLSVQLGGDHPSWQLDRAICAAVAGARRIVLGEEAAEASDA